MSESLPTNQTTVKEAIDILLYDEAQGVRKRKLIFELQSLVQKSEFAEAFLENDGLNIIMQQLKVTTGSVQGGLLQVLRGLLVYVNAIDQVSESPELVEAIYSLLVPSPDGTPISLSVAKPTLEILIVICGLMENGHKFINDAAKHRVGFNVLPYSPLIPLLSSSDLLTVRDTLLFMNILMKKKKNASEVKAKKLLFRWKECGVLSLLKPLTALEDEDIQKQLTVLQKTADFTIPRSWEEAHRFKTQLDEAKRKYETAVETLFIFQQQQAKMRLLKNELNRAQETIRALSIVLPTASTNYHPSRRFKDGGGLPMGALVSSAMEPIDTSVASQEISKARKIIFERFVSSVDFKDEARKVVGYKTGAHHIDPDEELPPPDDLPPPSEDGDLPPPMDDDELPPPSEGSDDLPPPMDDEDEGGAPPVPGAPHRGPSGPGHSAPGQAPSAPGGAPGGAPSGAPGAPGAPPKAPGSGAAALQESTISGAPAAIPAKKMGGPPPPPPPPGGKLGGPPPPPPPPGSKFPGRPGAAVVTDKRQFYKGPAPVKKMKPLHWEKLPLDETGTTMWHRIYNGEVNGEFDYEEFENMFSQKEVEERKEAPKPKKIMLLDDKTNQNISIMLHKLPSIPNIQRALLELDKSVLSREALVVIADQYPNPDIRAAFLKKVGTKPEEEYTPAEKYMAMVITTSDLDKRVAAWLFTLEWSENIQSALKPMHRLELAIQSVLNSKYLPYYFGVLLGFGNMMNHGSAKGNAPAIQLSLLSKLEMTKDNRGKTSLYVYLFNTIRNKNPDAMALPEELKPIFDGVKSLKWEDLEKSVQEAERAVQTFENQVRVVKKGLVAQGTDGTDPFVPLTTEFSVVAVKELKLLQDKFKELQGLNTKLQEYFGINPKRPLKPEQFFEELVPFVDKVKKSVAEAQKESRRSAKKGQKIDGGQLSDVVGKLQEQMISS